MVSAWLSAAPSNNPLRAEERRLAIILAGGFTYWLVFLLVLEPGNVLSAFHHGGLDPGRETLRIAAGSLIGAAVTPLMWWLVCRYPVAGSQKWDHLRRLVAADIILSATLVVTGCLLARMFLQQDTRPLLAALCQELLGNGPLVGFAVGAFLTLSHVVGASRSAASEDKPPPLRLLRIPIKTHGRTEIIDVNAVDWIETQGNYLALHGCNKVWHLRETATRLEVQLDPSRFARIHRRTIVALDRVRSIAPAGAGDALLCLIDGTELRVSRNYRHRLTGLLAPHRGSTSASVTLLS